MAKAKNLAGLAALGALGYMLTRDKPSENAGEQKTSSYTGDTKKVEAMDAGLESPEDTIKRSMVKAPGESKPITEADVVMPEKAESKKVASPRPPSAPKAVSKPVPKPAPKPTPKGIGRLDPGGRSASLAALDARKAARDEDARIGNINAYNNEIKGQNMETRVLKNMQDAPEPGMMKKGGKVKKMASGGMTASSRGDGIASRGKTRGKIC